MSDARRFDLVVLDWDGTVVDSEVRIVRAVTEAIARLRLPERTPAQIGNIIGLGLRAATEALFPDCEADLPERFAATYREQFARGGGAPPALFPRAYEAIESLRDAGYRLAVATGKNRAGLDRELAGTRLRRLFDATRCADEAPSKPHPAMLRAVIDEVGASAARTVMVGDTSYDLEMARAAGVAAVAVESGVHAVERLLDFAPLVVLASIADLPPWLFRHHTE